MTRGRVAGQQGSVRRLPSGRWQARLPRGIDPAQRAPEPGVTYETRAEALAAIEVTLRGIQDGSIVLEAAAPPDPAGPYTVEKMMVRFLQEHRDLSVGGRRHYRNMMSAVLCKPGVGIGEVPVARLTTPMLREWKLGLREKGVTPSMERAAWKTLSSALSWEVDMARLTVSPATLPSPRGTKTRRAAATRTRSHSDAQPTWAEFAQILAAIPDRRDRLMVLILGWAGLRRAEAAALPPTCLTIDGSLSVADTWVYDDASKIWVLEPVKTGKVKVVPIPRGLTTLIRAEARRWQPREGMADLLLPNSRTHVFPGAYSKEAWRDHVWQPMRTATGLTTTTASLRGYAASMLVDAGATLMEVRDFLGHADTTTTERHYARSQALRATDPDRLAVRLGGSLTVQQRLDALWVAWEKRFGKPLSLKAA